MSLLRKRLENLEAAIAPPERRPYCIWGTVQGGAAGTRRKTKREIQGEIDAAIASGTMSVIDRPLVVCWKAPQ